MERMTGCGGYLGAGGQNNTRVRREKRKHTLRCLQAVLSQQRLDATCLSNKEITVLESLRQHASDCKQLAHNVHAPSLANTLMKTSGHKSQQTYNEHRQLHRAAGKAKHVHLAPVSTTAWQGDITLPPMPPPQELVMPPLPGILCSDLEKTLLEKVINYECGLWTNKFVPFAGTAWNLDAPVFVPTANPEDIWGNVVAEPELVYVRGDCTTTADPEPSVWGDCANDGELTTQANAYCRVEPHWLDSIPTDLLDMLFQADSSIFEKVTACIPKHLQHIADAFYADPATNQIEYNSDEFIVTLGFDDFSGSGGVHFYIGDADDCGTMPFGVPSCLYADLPQIVFVIEDYLSTQGCVEEGASNLKQDGLSYELGSNFCYNVDNDMIANEVPTACSLTTLVLFLSIILQYVLWPCAYVVAKIRSGFTNSSCVTGMWAAPNSLACEEQKEFAPDASVRRIMRHRDVVQGHVGNIGPIPLAANIHEQRKLKSQAQQQAQQQKLRKGRKR